MSHWQPGQPGTDEKPAGPTCPSCGAGDPAGVEVRGVYDGVLFWQCQQCGTPFHRWPEGSPDRVRAEPFVAAVELGRPGSAGGR